MQNAAGGNMVLCIFLPMEKAKFLHQVGVLIKEYLVSANRENPGNDGILTDKIRKISND